MYFGEGFFGITVPWMYSIIFFCGVDLNYLDLSEYRRRHGFNPRGSGLLIDAASLLYVPQEFLEAARIERAREGQIFWRIGLSIMKPALISLGVLTFIWNEFLWTLVVVTKKELFTVTIVFRCQSPDELRNRTCRRYG